MATLEPLPWDTRMLRRPAARLEFILAEAYEPRRAAAEALLETALSEARRAGFEHLSVRVDAADDAAIHALEEAGFLSVDVLLTFEREVGSGIQAPAGGGFSLREGHAEDAGAVGTLAASSFIDGRFHADPSIDPETAASVYREWGASCCRGTAADGVVVADVGEEIVGFIACRLHPDTGTHLSRLTASIVLVATAPAVRGRGIGKAIVGAALDWSAQRAAVVVQVGTQIRNAAAARLYEQCGFRLVTASQSFRAVMRSVAGQDRAEIVGNVETAGRVK